jgi:hypothetical protein
MPPTIDFRYRRLRRLLQRLKSLILTDLDSTTRTQVKQQLIDLDQQYQNIDKNTSNSQFLFDEYKIKSIALLCKYRDPNWVEQFLYRETGNFLTQAEKFAIVEQITSTVPPQSHYHQDPQR